MASNRRIGSEDSSTRAALLDAALRLMLDEGYAAVTSRRVAAEAGLKPQLVHYYFRTMDDLFLALIRRGAEQNLERSADVLASPRPLRALWELSADPRGTALTIEFAALANHRKAIRGEFAAYAEQFRRLQSEVLASVFASYGIGEDEIAPDVAHVLMTGVAQVLAMEETLGISAGHEGTRAFVEAQLARFEGEPTT